MTDFREKAEIFNSFIAKQCSLINSNGSLPCEIIKKTNDSLDSVRFSTEDILKIINIRFKIRLIVTMRLVFEC